MILLTIILGLVALGMTIFTIMVIKDLIKELGGPDDIIISITLGLMIIGIWIAFGALCYSQFHEQEYKVVATYNITLNGDTTGYIVYIENEDGKVYKVLNESLTEIPITFSMTQNDFEETYKILSED